MSTGDLLVTIEIVDGEGVVEERNVTTYRKLLAAAHADGLSAVATDITRGDTDGVIVKASVTTSKGTFTGIGDASTSNVPEKLRNALPRVAETRAVCRALRAALGVGYVAVEELAETVRFVRKEREAAQPRETPSSRGEAPREREGSPERARGRDDRPTEAGPEPRRAMSADQRKLLFRLAYGEGHDGNAARDRVLDVLGVQRLEHATRADASRAIDTLRRAAVSRGNGHSNGASHGPP